VQTTIPGALSHNQSGPRHGTDDADDAVPAQRQAAEDEDELSDR
jgi:hypothetical protein